MISSVFNDHSQNQLKTINPGRSFSKIEAAAATLGSHSICCFTERFDNAIDHITEKIKGALFLSSWQIFSSDNSAIFFTSTLLRTEGCFKDTSKHASIWISFKANLRSSAINFLILNAAEAMSFQVPLKRALPSGSN